MSSLIYLATPYTHADPSVVTLRYLANVRSLAELMRAGLRVISPIAMCHPAAVAYELPGDYAYWRDLDHELIDACACVYVLALPGWRSSVGVADEVAYAIAQGKPVYRIDPADPCTDKIRIWGVA